MSVFEECWERVNRAGTHGKAVVDGCNRLLGDESYRIVPELRNERDGVLKIVPNVIADDTLSLELGEYFYQVRAALDSAMWKAFEIVGTSDPTTKESQLYFPIIEKPSSLKDATFQKINLPDALKAWLCSIQPCNASKRAKDSEESTISDALLVINNCAKHDRHHKLHLVGAYLTQSTAHVEVTPPAIVTHLESITTGDYFKGEFVVAEYIVEGWTPETQVRGNGSFGVEVSVKEIPAGMGAELGSRLAHLSNITRFCIQEIEQAVL